MCRGRQRSATSQTLARGELPQLPLSLLRYWQRGKFVDDPGSGLLRPPTKLRSRSHVSPVSEIIGAKNSVSALHLPSLLAACFFLELITYSVYEPTPCESQFFPCLLARLNSMTQAKFTGRQWSATSHTLAGAELPQLPLPLPRYRQRGKFVDDPGGGLFCSPTKLRSRSHVSPVAEIITGRNNVSAFRLFSVPVCL